jgi:hypothetical protein
MTKNPNDRPDFWKEKGGPCPNCGWPETVAQKSRKTGELYFGCARPKQGPKHGCNFKGCRSHWILNWVFYSVRITRFYNLLGF